MSLSAAMYTQKANHKVFLFVVLACPVTDLQSPFLSPSESLKQQQQQGLTANNPPP